MRNRLLPAFFVILMTPVDAHARRQPRQRCKPLIKYQGTTFTIKAKRLRGYGITVKDPELEISRTNIREAQAELERRDFAAVRMCNAVNGARGTTLWEDAYKSYSDSLKDLVKAFDAYQSAG